MRGHFEDAARGQKSRLQAKWSFETASSQAGGAQVTLFVHTVLPILVFAMMRLTELAEQAKDSPVSSPSALSTPSATMPVFQKPALKCCGKTSGRTQGHQRFPVYGPHRNRRGGAVPHKDERFGCGGRTRDSSQCVHALQLGRPRPPHRRAPWHLHSAAGHANIIGPEIGRSV